MSNQQSTDPCANGHNLVPGAPIQHPDGSQSPTLICTRCPYRAS